MVEPTSLGRWLKERRRALDLTQQELAAKAGCSTVTIHKIETGALLPSKEIAERLAAALEIAPDARAAFVRFARSGRLSSSADDAPLRRAGAPQVAHNLPFPATPLIGREADLAALRKRLHDGARLVTLVGPPGIGKTRLALEAAYQMLDEYADGAFFVYLAPVTDPAQVAGAIGRVMNVPEARARPMAAQIKSHLRDRQILLILDNFEHVVDTAPLVADLLDGCPWLTIVATSRQPLQIRGERQYLVLPLAVPEANTGSQAALTAAQALHYSAVALFVERAEAAAPGFGLADASAASVAEICRRLDGVPLAIELVAAHVRLLSPQELLERWSGSWVLASGWLRDAPARHSTLHEAVDWSYRLLDDGEKALLCRLAVFAGAADLRAIEAVCDCHDLDCLAALIAKSLVKRVAGAEGEGRYVLLEMIREYAAGRLAAGGQEAEIRMKHAGYYRRLASDGHRGINGPEQMYWFRRLEMEQPNLRSALAWTLSRDPQEQRPAVEIGLLTAVDLFWFWSIRGHLREGLEWLERGLSATEGWGATTARANAMWGAGVCAGVLGFGRQSRAHFDACMAACRFLIEHNETAEPAPGRSDDFVGACRALGYALVLRAFFRVGREDIAETSADLEQGIAILREAGDEPDLAYALDFLGHWAGRNGEVELARPALEESYALFAKAGNLWGATLALGNLGRLFEYLGDFERCRAFVAEKGLPAGVLQQLGEMQRVHVVVWWLSFLAGSDGDAARRFDVFRQAIRLQEALGYRSFVESSLYEMVYLALQAGLPVRAVRLAAATQVWLEQLQMHLEVPPELAAVLADVRARLGEGLFARAWAEGRAMTIPESAAYALSGEE